MVIKCEAFLRKGGRCPWKTRFPRASITLSKTASYGRFYHPLLILFFTPSHLRQTTPIALFQIAGKRRSAGFVAGRCMFWAVRCVGSIREPPGFPAALHRHVAQRYADESKSCIFTNILCACIGLGFWNNQKCDKIKKNKRGGPE